MLTVVALLSKPSFLAYQYEVVRTEVDVLLAAYRLC